MAGGGTQPDARGQWLLALRDAACHTCGAAIKTGEWVRRPRKFADALVCESCCKKVREP